MPAKGSRKSRICKCGETDPDNFYIHQASECKQCLIKRTASHQKGNKQHHRKRWLHRAYNWTPEKYDSELAKQHGLCALCGKPFQKDEVPRVDHNHETGETRGLIHQHCNSLLGFAREDTAVLLAAIDYLARYRKSF